jgi:secondary thiamine-phosphate synthase enzyme
MEGELLLLSDVNTYLNSTFPKDNNYRHDIIEIRDVPIDERVNGYSHMRQLFFSSDATIPVKDGKMLLGKWQTVFLVEFDPIRDRDVYITYYE